MMKRFAVLCVAAALAACGSSTEPTGLTPGDYDLKSIGGQFGGGRIDPTVNCGQTYGGVSYLHVSDRQNAFLYLSTYDYCYGDPNNPSIYRDIGTYTVSGTSVSFNFARGITRYPGTINANGDSLVLTMPDVALANPGMKTASWLFVRE